MILISLINILFFSSLCFSQEYRHFNIDVRECTISNGSHSELMRMSKKIRKKTMKIICDGDTINGVSSLSGDSTLLKYSQIDLLFKFKKQTITIYDIRKYLCTEHINIIFFYNVNNLDNKRIYFTSNKCGHVDRTELDDTIDEHHHLYISNYPTSYIRDHER